MLQGALGLLAAVRGGNDRMSDGDYVAWGLRANHDALIHESGPIIDRFREDDFLEDTLQTPFVVQHVTALQSAMQAAVAGATGRNRHAVAGPEFPPRFGAFVLGFAAGMVVGHRARSADVPVEKLTRRTVDSCAEWGEQAALAYLVLVEAAGIFDKTTDRNDYGIEDNWRSLATSRAFEPTDALHECLAAGRSAGTRWGAGANVDLGAALASCLPRAEIAAGL